MLFWTGILVSGLFIWLAIRIGFYEILVMFFNIVISIYVSIFLSPVIVDYFPSANDTLFYNTFALSIVSIGTFLILHTISYVFLTGQFKVSFHKIFDILFAGMFGFLTGLLIFSFFALVITVTPLAQYKFISQIGFNKNSQQTNISYICWWCDLVNTAVSSDDKMKSIDIIDELIKKSQIKESENNNETKPNSTEKQTKPIESSIQENAPESNSTVPD
ncbi:MAG: CvpA family protein [Sedimentisphaerales bacterium]|nr:CvpA family protein [Sedimentisphaerales bacterium]